MPIIVPEGFSNYKMLSIDPGLNNTGIAIFEIDYNTKIINSIEAYTILTNKLYNNTGLDEEFFTERKIKLYKLKRAIQEILILKNPCIVACESPFFNPMRPMAYGALLEVLSIIHSSIIEYNSNIPFISVEPLLVKKIIGAGMMKGKLDVKEAVKNNKSIISKLRNNIELLDEHSIDAIAVGYTFLNTRGS